MVERFWPAIDRAGIDGDWATMVVDRSGGFVRHSDYATLETESARLKEINANLMGDDEDAPRYTTKRLKQEIAKAVALSAAQEAAPEVTETGPVPTYECEFRVGQPVRLSNPYAEDDPDRTFYVTGIDWEYRSVVGHGWNITVATAEEIARGYGATDGFTPSDLTAAQEAGKP